MISLADSLIGASKEGILAAAARLTPNSPHLANTVGNLMIARALRMAERRSVRNLSDYQQSSL